MEVESKAPERLQQVGDEELLSQPQTVQGHSAGLIVPKVCTRKSLLQRLHQPVQGCLVPLSPSPQS